MGEVLSTQAADKLAKVCGMLGSAHDGERAAAAIQADNIVRHELGMTWDEVFAAVTAERRKWKEPRDSVEAVATALAWPEALNAWETRFLNEVFGKRRFSFKQKDCLAKIIDKVRKYATAAGGCQ